MNSSFFKSTLIFILISIIFITFCFSSAITTLTYSSNEVAISGGTLVLPDNIKFYSSNFLWPTPRI